MNELTITPLVNQKVAEAVLNTPIECELGDSTIGGYLCELLITLLNEGESFSGKRPLGNSGWENYLLTAMAQGGFIEATFDSEGYLDQVTREEEKKAFNLINDVILYKFSFY
jgi:hypothetical protein